MSTPLIVDLWRLRRCLETTLPFASPDDMLPSVNAVRLRTRRGHLVAEATDRIVVGIYRLPIDSKVEFDALIPRASVRQILSMFKPTRAAWDQTQVQLTISQNANTNTTQLRIHSHRGELLSAAELDCKWDLITTTPPPLDRVIAQALADKPEATTYAVRPELLAKFTGVLPKHTPLLVRAGRANGPIVLSTPENDFLGAIMPIRSTGNVGGQPDYSAWPEYLPAKSDDENKPGAVA